MSNLLVEQIVDVLKKMNWPKTSNITSESQELFSAGLDAINTYRGDPDDLIGALQLFFATNVLSYSLAGAALIMSQAAYLSGDIFDQNGLQKARDLIQSAKGFSPNRSEIELIDADIWISLRQYPKAREILDRVEKTGLLTIQLCLTEMHYWYKSNLFNLEAWFQRGCQLNLSQRQHTNLFNRMAGYYLELQIADKALALYEQIAAVDPTDPWLWHNMSIIYLRINRFSEAYHCNRNALKIMDFGAAREVGNYLSGWSNAMNEIEEAKRDLKNDPSHADIHLRKMADAYIATAQYQEAIQALNNLIKINPKDANGYNQRGHIYNQLKLFDNAISDFTKAIKIYPKNATYYYNRGNSYYEKRDPRRASENYTDALKLHPEYGLAYLNRGNCHRAMRNYEKAIADYSKVISIYPRDALAYLNRGLVCVAQGKRAQAKHDLEAALALEDNNPEIRDKIRKALAELQAKYE